MDVNEAVDESGYVHDASSWTGVDGLAAWCS